VVYAQLKYMWAQDVKEGTLAELRQFRLAKDLQAESLDLARGASQAAAESTLEIVGTLLFQVGEWQVAHDDSDDSDENQWYGYRVRYSSHHLTTIVHSFAG